MWKLNGILLSDYGIIPGQVEGEGLAIKGIFDLPKRLGTTFKDWDDQDSVQPYVEADEIFLEGRNIVYSGILEGTKAETELNIEWLKIDIGNFNSVVPFETPYGSFCVYVKQITSKIYNGIATVNIEFREPEIGGVCGVNTGDTTYYSEIYSETAIKNNCVVGYHGLEVALASTLGQFISTVSQLAANQLAVAWVRENKQDHANVAEEGTYCIVNPPVFYNEEQSKSLSRNNCGNGYTGTTIVKKVLKETHKSYVSLADANAKAMAELDSILTQEYVNSVGTCEYLVSFKKTGESYFTINSSEANYGVPVGTRVHSEGFIIGTHMQVGTKYSMMIYGHVLTIVTQSNDTNATLIARLRSLINTFFPDWNQYNLQGVYDIDPNAGPPLIAGVVLTVWTSGLAKISIWVGDRPTWDLVDPPPVDPPIEEL